jgi:hypothetical protein
MCKFSGYFSSNKCLMKIDNLSFNSCIILNTTKQSFMTTNYTILYSTNISDDLSHILCYFSTHLSILKFPSFPSECIGGIEGVYICKIISKSLDEGVYKIRLSKILVEKISGWLSEICATNIRFSNTVNLGNFAEPLQKIFGTLSLSKKPSKMLTFNF